MSTAHVTLATLREQRPEWGPWLGVVHAMQREIAGTEWDAAAAAIETTATTDPLLAHAALTCDADLPRATLHRLAAAARTSDCEPLASAVSCLRDDRVDAMAMFVASIADDRLLMAGLVGTPNAEVLHPLIAFVSMPFLHACRRRHESHVRGWGGTYCPICASWPAFVEVRGIERTRYARCGRCGTAWHAQLLKCPYCEANDHEELITLMPQGSDVAGSIEACQTCGGYTKVFTTLQGCAPTSAYVEDLASADLDIAALDAGYVRPRGLAVSLALRAPARGVGHRGGWWDS